MLQIEGSTKSRLNQVRLLFFLNSIMYIGSRVCLPKKQFIPGFLPWAWGEEVLVIVFGCPSKCIKEPCEQWTHFGVGKLNFL
jgi:hypothetical protein